MRNKEKKDDVVSYITYNRGQGRIQKGGKVMFKEFEEIEGSRFEVVPLVMEEL